VSMWSSVSQYAVSIHAVYMVSMYYHILPALSCGSPYIAHVVRVAHHILSTRSSVSQYIARVVRVYHDMGYQFTLSTRSSGSPCIVSIHSVHVVECFIVSMWSSVSQYAVSIHAVYMVSMCYHILPTLSECIMICRINSYCPCGRVSHLVLCQFMVSM